MRRRKTENYSGLPENRQIAKCKYFIHIYVTEGRACQMYLHLGADVVIMKNSIIGIFDLDTSTVSKHTKNYLALAQREGRVVTVTNELPRSFVTASENGVIMVYISQLSSSTLLKRWASEY